MKNQVIFCLFFLSILPILAIGQQSAGQTGRATTPEMIFEIQRGEVELFKTLAYRFEIAWSESDLQSMIDLQEGLWNLMEKEIQQATDNANLSEKAKTRLQNQQQLLPKAKAVNLTSSKDALGKKGEQANQLFQDFIKHMETDLTEQVVALQIGRAHV